MSDSQMQAKSRKMTTLWLWTSAALLWASACTVQGNPAALRIVGNVYASRQDKTQNICLPLQSQQFRAVGVLDLAVAAVAYNQFWFYTMVENRLSPTPMVSGNSAAQLRSDTSYIVIDSMTGGLADSLLADGTSAGNGPFAPKSPIRTSKLSGVDSTNTERTWLVPANMLVDAGKQSFGPMVAIPANVVQEWYSLVKKNLKGDALYAYREDLTLAVQVDGHMGDGTIVHSAPLNYPITLCYGCLIYNSSISATVNADGSVITAADQWKHCSFMSVPADYISPCIVGQDDYVECGQYCQLCTEKSGTASACDKHFCPDLTADEINPPAKSTP